MECFERFIDHLPLIIAFLTLAASIVIAINTSNLSKKQFYRQQWNDLVSMYSSTEFGVAVKCMVDFYVYDCKRDRSRIKDEYQKRFEKEVEYEDTNGKIIILTAPEKSLHFQKRLVSLFYWRLNICVNQKGFDKKLLKDYFDENEINIMNLAILLNQAVADNELYHEIQIGLKERKENLKINDQIEPLRRTFEKVFGKKIKFCDGRVCRKSKVIN